MEIPSKAMVNKSLSGIKQKNLANPGSCGYAISMIDKEASNPSKRSSNAGGVFLALGALVGVIAGGFLGQPTIGLLSGLAIGALIALIIWLVDR